MTSLCLCALYITLGSYHGNRERGYNEFNPGVIIESQSWMGGYYRNSFNKDTFLLGRTFDLSARRGVRVSFAIGWATGYHTPVMAGFFYEWSRHSVMLVPPVSDAKGIIAYRYKLISHK